MNKTDIILMAQLTISDIILKMGVGEGRAHVCEMASHTFYASNLETIPEMLQTCGIF